MIPHRKWSDSGMQLVLVLQLLTCTLSPRDTSTVAKAAKRATPVRLPGERGVHFRCLVAPRELVSLTSRESIN